MIGGNVLRNLVRKAATKIGLSWLLAQVRAAADGRLGPEWKARYWALEGKKTITGFGFLALTVVLVAIGQDEAAAITGTVAGLAVSVGLLDKAWRSELPEFLLRSQLYQWLARNAELVTTVFTLAAGWVSSVEGPEQKTYALVLAALAALAVQLGLLDAAWKATPPSARRCAVTGLSPRNGRCLLVAGHPGLHTFERLGERRGFSSDL